MKKNRVSQTTLFVVFMCTVLTFTTGLVKAEMFSTLGASPARITMNGNGDLLVTDYIFGQVLTIDPLTLDITGEININGRPLGVAWADGLIYVGNSTTGQVEVYNSLGHLQFILGYGNLPVKTPQDIDIGNGNVYVVDGSENIVKVFNMDGAFTTTIPTSGYDRTLLANPTAIAVDEVNRQIFVSDFGDLGSANVINPRIQVFDFDGSLSFTIDADQANKYLFSAPQGLTLNGNDELYMIDSLTGAIHIFNAKNGSLLGKVKGSGLDSVTFQMKMPLDLVIDKQNNNLFVTNNMLSSIKVFEGVGGI